MDNARQRDSRIATVVLLPHLQNPGRARRTPRRRSAILAKLCRCRISCFVLTKGLAPPKELISAAGSAQVPLLTTPLESTTFIKLLSGFLEERLATRLHLHSVLLDVFGLGTLIVHTAGTQNASVMLAGLEYTTAMWLRDRVVRQRKTVDVV